MLDLVLLAAFLVFNYFVLRWLARRLVVESAWLRDPDQLAEVLRLHGPAQLREFLIFRRWSSLSNNPIALLITHVGLIYGVLWADYVTIRDQWPWLLGS